MSEKKLINSKNIFGKINPKITDILKSHNIEKLYPPQEKALKLNGSKVGSHLFAPEKPMKGWVSIPEKHSEEWNKFAEKALKYMEELEK